MDYYKFEIPGNACLQGRTFTRTKDEGITPNLYTPIPAFAATGFADWLRMERPLEKGDLVTFRAGRYITPLGSVFGVAGARSDIGEVISVHGKKVWIHAIWATNSEQSLEPLNYVSKRIDSDELLSDLLGERNMTLEYFNAQRITEG